MKNLKLIVSFTTIVVFLFNLTIPSSNAKEGSKAKVDDQKTLIEVAASRSSQDRQRDTFRHPQQTLAFFGIKSGMQVVEVLPAGGWYSRVLAPYLGQNGRLHAMNYTDETWSYFGDGISQDFVRDRGNEIRNWANYVENFGGNPDSVEGFTFGEVPKQLQGQVDAVLMIRALHNLNRFEKRGETLTQSMGAIHKLLKAGGIVGVVQHRAPKDADDEWAQGQNGYMKTAHVIELFESYGFQFVSHTEVNANPKDRPQSGDNVWRLPPTLNSKEDPELLKKYLSIGESDRMTLKFRKTP